MQEEKEISLKDLIRKVKDIVIYLKSRWVLLVFCVIIGIGAGLVYAFLKGVRYTSKVSFVVEDTKSGAGGLAALAGQFGFDIGGSAGGGFFSGDNVLLFLKSESLCRQVLMTSYDSSSNTTLADKYAESNRLASKWAKRKKIGIINFGKYRSDYLPRLEDSLMQIMVRFILKENLVVEKPDKKASFVTVSMTSKDELLSKYFSDRLVDLATAHYVESKTRVKSQNVMKLQKRADSLANLLNAKSYAAATVQQDILDINPGIKTAPVSAEISTREKTMIATIFAEVVKNLELAKVLLSQETPTVEVVDTSTLPLKEEKVNKLLSALSGAVIVSFVVSLILVLKKWWHTADTV